MAEERDDDQFGENEDNSAKQTTGQQRQQNELDSSRVSRPAAWHRSRR